MFVCLQNYGDESDAYGLINPNIYSNHGVYEKDFFLPRDHHEVTVIHICFSSTDHGGVVVSYDAADCAAI